MPPIALRKAASEANAPRRADLTLHSPQFDPIAFLERRSAYLLGKRLFDISNALVQLVLLSPVFLVAACMAKLFDRGPVFFTQERLTGGRGGPRVFKIIKFRTMVPNAEALGARITAKDDPRVTPFGKVLRATKLDEIPQLINILKGEMSFVGPRPQTLGYVELFKEHYNLIHSAVPAGLTDLATLRYREEAKILAQASDPENEYLRHIMPDKIACHFAYVNNLSFGMDCYILWQTVFHVFVRKPISKLLSAREASRGGGLEK